jgi:hypothetical protein
MRGRLDYRVLRARDVDVYEGIERVLDAEVHRRRGRKSRG